MSWKVVAFIFMILFILETGAVAWVFMTGVTLTNKRQACANLCTEGGATSFGYPLDTQICSCYDDAGMVIHSEVFK